MPDQRSRSLTVLSRLLGGLGAASAVVIFGLHFWAPESIKTPLAYACATWGAIAGVYFLTIHLLIKKYYLAFSTLILSIITIVNFALVITATGGLDSPFYSIWLLAIIVAGLFGNVETIILLSTTLIYYVIDFWVVHPTGTELRDRFIQLCITLAAAALAEWVHSRNRKASAATSKLEKMSGQLSTEQLKADAIMSSIGEGVMVIDSMKRIQLFNKAAQNLTGWDEVSAQNIEYNLVLQLHTGDDQAITSLNDPFTDAWKKHEQVMRDDLVLTTHAGRKIQMSLSISPIFDAKGQPSGAIALFRDISAEKEIARQKDEFVSTASHEMRTPVAAIEGYISLAMNSNVATIDDRAKKYLEKAHDTIQHLGELFRDLLSVTKADEGKLAGRIEAVNLGQLVKSAVDDMQFTVQKKKITLIFQITEQPGKVIAPLFYVAANPERLREVVMNLIDNAYKYTEQGGIKVTLDGNDKEATVSISDSGMGIAQEDIGHLFQKFYRIDSSAVRTVGGTGLGLYLCRRLIESFNGRIWVESKLNEGSTFKFSLPRLTAIEISQLHAAAAEAATAAGEPVLPSPDATPAPPPAAQPMPIPVAAEAVALPTEEGTPLVPVTLSAAAPAPMVTASAMVAGSAPAVRPTTDGISRRMIE